MICANSKYTNLLSNFVYFVKYYFGIILHNIVDASEYFISNFDDSGKIEWRRLDQEAIACDRLADFYTEYLVDFAFICLCRNCLPFIDNLNTHSKFTLFFNEREILFGPIELVGT